MNALVFEYIEGCSLQDLSTEKKKTIEKVVADNARTAVRPLKEFGILHCEV